MGIHDFGIGPADKVLAIGIDGWQFPHATHFAVGPAEGGHRGEALIDSRPRIPCDLHATPFNDKEFDFVYCIHVLERVADPARACGELMRVARRGYLECRRSWFEFLVSAAEHRWLIDFECDTLIFRERLPDEARDVLGLRKLVARWLRNATYAQRVNSARIRGMVNVELYWEDAFQVWVIDKAQRLGKLRRPACLAQRGIQRQ